MIKRVEFDRKRKGTKRDESGKYIGYQVDITAQGKRLRPVFETRKKAEGYVEQVRLAAKLKRAGVRVHVSPPTVADLFDARIAQITNHAEKIRARRIFDRFLSLVQQGLKVTDVRKADFIKFKNSRLADGVKPETVNREMNPLSKAFTSAPDLFPDALDEYERPTIKRPEFKRKRRERIITPEEKDAILKYLYAPQGEETDAVYRNRIRIGRMFHIAYLLGMAYKEVAWAKKTDYDGTQFAFERAKTGNWVSFEFLPDEAHDVLRAAIADSDTDFIFTHTGSTPKNFYPRAEESGQSGRVGLGPGRRHYVSQRETFFCKSRDAAHGSEDSRIDDGTFRLYGRTLVHACNLRNKEKSIAIDVRQTRSERDIR